MRRLFVDSSVLASDPVRIDGPDAHHLLHVLRMQAGEEVTLLDGAGRAVAAVITSFGKRDLELRILHAAEIAPEPPLHVTIAQAIGKGDRFEQVIQHGTEVGASAFIPLLTERTIVRISPEDADSKIRRWRQVAKGAAEQAGRSRIPAILAVAPLSALLQRGSANDLILLDLCGEPLRARLQDMHARGTVTLAVGPEGGFSPDELELARASGTRIATLGPYTLRTETAAIVALSRILDGGESA